MKTKYSNRKQLGKIKNQVVFPITESIENMPTSYLEFIKNLKNRIKTKRLKNILSANASMILMYWDIGNSILERQQKEGWGTKVIDRLSFDLKKEFPSIKGFSPRNLKYMRKLAQCWTDKQIVQRTVAQIPWRSNITLMDKIKDPKLRLYEFKNSLPTIEQIENELNINK